MDRFYRFMIGVAFTFLLFSIFVRAAYSGESIFEDQRDEYTITGQLEPKDAIAIQQLKERGTIKISSIGGDAGLADLILKEVIDKKLNTVCLDLCASAGAVIFLAGASHFGQQVGADLIFHAPGIDLPDGSRMLAPKAYIDHWKETYVYLGVDKLMSETQWDAMWSRAEVVIEIPIK